MNVVDNIFEIMLQKGIKQQILADVLNCHNSVISNLKTGKRELKVRELEIIANLLNLRPIDLFTYPDVYVKADGTDGPIEAVIQIKLRNNKKEQVLRMIFGDSNLELL